MLKVRSKALKSNFKSSIDICKHFSTDRSASIINGFKNSIGNTPLIKLESFSQESGCNILVKNEYMNPGGILESNN